MKLPFKLLLLLTAFTFLLCTPVTYIPKVTLIGVLNFKKYLDNGFLFTPNTYAGDYESVGIISITVTPEAVREKVKHKDGGISYRWKCDTIKSEEILDKISEKAIKMGADAIINFTLEDYSVGYNQAGPSPITVNGFTARGFAIKRKGAFMPPKRMGVSEPKYIEPFNENIDQPDPFTTSE